MSLVLEVQSTIKEFESKNEYCPKCNDYENAMKNYKSLIETGVTKPRENNLLPIEKRHVMHHEINR